MNRIKHFVMMLAVMLTFGLVATGCASSGRVINEAAVAGAGETLVVVQRESAFVGSGIKVEIYIDGKPALQLPNGATGNVVVPNGQHTIYAKGLRPMGGQPPSDTLVFTANSTEIFFTTGAMGSASASAFLTMEN
jgi:hypothetical protein